MIRRRKQKPAVKYVSVIVQGGTGRLVAAFTSKRKCQKALNTLRALDDKDYCLIALPFNETRQHKWDF